MASLQDNSLWMANPKLENWFDKTWLVVAKVMIISHCVHGIALLIETLVWYNCFIEELENEMHQLKIGKGKKKL